MFTVRGGSVPSSNPLPFNIPVFVKNPFRIPSIDKWYPFHIPCLELCIPFNCCKCTVFLIAEESITKIERFLDFLLPSVSPFGPFHADSKERFPIPFMYFNELNPYPFIHLRLEKDTPFGRRLSVWAIPPGCNSSGQIPAHAWTLLF